MLWVSESLLWPACLTWDLLCPCSSAAEGFEGLPGLKRLCARFGLHRRKRS
jgi:hypothetical protein